LGALAAKSVLAERLIIPMVDVLQAIPVLGFLSITVWGFIALFPGSRLGPECAAIFVIFTSQVWNMILSFYQSLRTLPLDLQEASAMLGLSGWRRFWRVEVPFAMPGLLWNTMVSMSAGWFFVVASEAISVANQQIALPGVGSYIALAVEKANLHAIGYAIVTMFVVIFIYDQLLFRPMNQWADKFQLDSVDLPKRCSWVVVLFNKTSLLRYGSVLFDRFVDAFVNWQPIKTAPRPVHRQAVSTHVWGRLCWSLLWVTMALVIGAVGLYFLMHWFSWGDLVQVLYLGMVTTARIAVLILLCLVVWVPVGVWIGLRPRVTRLMQPVIQFLAAFPANLLFPLVVMLIVRYHLNVEIWTSPLMILGTQWYILFNAIAGTVALPKHLHQVGQTFQVRGWLWWRRIILPGIFPFLITGTISAAGGAWNASILAESVNWGLIQLHATGLGSFITQATRQGHFPALSLGIGVMCLFVLIINRILWRPLYRIAETKFSLS
jgi:NitT/TauT family transport system permease protein